jgi:intracellular sulfur oxidation DsrE/DsrF family protein
MNPIACDNPIRDDEPRNIVMHVNFADPERLNLVLNNVENILDHYTERNNTVAIRVVCHGPGLHLLRTDTSPVKARILQMTDNSQRLSFYACSNTVARMTKAEGKAPELIEAAVPVPAGLPEIIELQRQGWIYLKP